MLSSSPSLMISPSFCSQTGQQASTYQFQNSLPSLPVPPLTETCSRYLRSLQPLHATGRLSTEEFEKTKSIIAEFQKPGGRGERLHNKLLERAKTKKNWLEDWW